MKALELSVAGKTFVVGEYLALTGGPALILATEPRFRLQVQPSSLVLENPFHPLSPAGWFWQAHSDFFSRYEIRFQDPYQVGGFGASSAQFALLHAFWQLQEEAFGESERFLDWHQMLMDYRGQPTEGSKPSGADVVGAVTGGLAWFDRNNGKVQAFAWPFQEVELLIAHTGKKLATHDHLKTLAPFDTQGFQKAMQDVLAGLSNVHFETFLQGLKAYRAQLEAQGKVAEFTRALVGSLEKHPELLFVKGCGAMGSDVILVLCLQEKVESARTLMKAHQLAVFADSSRISQGLQIQNLTLKSEELSL